jgi:hypothetical protein
MVLTAVARSLLTFEECRLQVAFAPASLPHLTIDMTSLLHLQQARVWGGGDRAKKRWGSH